MTVSGATETTNKPSNAPRIRKIEAIVNPAAGSAGPGAGAAIEVLLAEFAIPARVRTAYPEDLRASLQSAIDAGPDLLIILAGDGTARIAASLCGPEGPLLAPLPGGTMNMLPEALYGPKDWMTALRDLLTHGVETPVSGGAIDDRHFHVAAVLGAPTMWAEVREAARHRNFRLAMTKAQNAWRRAFATRLKFACDGGPQQRARALTLMCPLVSRIMADDEGALEADALDPEGAMEVFRLGFRTLMSVVAGDWRDDPSVRVTRCRRAEAWARGHMPAILDGEPVRLHKHVDIRFVPKAFRALAPPRPTPGEGG